MRAFALSTLIALSTLPAAAQPATRVDKGQAETAARLIGDGDTVRVYCKLCADVAYSEITVRSKELRPSRGGFELYLNGEPVDIAWIYIDAGYGGGWENLAVMLGAEVDVPAAKLSPALDDVVRLAPHAGSYTGEIGRAAVRVDLVLTGRKLDGSYVRTDDALSFKLLATAYNLTSQSESLTLIERGAKDRVTATLQGVFDADGSFTGVRTPLGAAGGEPFALTRTAPSE